MKGHAHGFLVSFGVSEFNRTVWVLGSGFSQPLGGPMLTDLMSPQGIEEVLEWASDDLQQRPDHWAWIPHVARVTNAFRIGLKKTPAQSREGSSVAPPLARCRGVPGAGGSSEERESLVGRRATTGESLLHERCHRSS
jgi:hypothetical protein